MSPTRLVTRRTMTKHDKWYRATGRLHARRLRTEPAVSAAR